MSTTENTVHESVVGKPKQQQSAKEKYGKGVINSLQKMHMNKKSMMAAIKADAERPREETTVTKRRTETKYLDDDGLSFF